MRFDLSPVVTASARSFPDSMKDSTSTSGAKTTWM
jgi:hypothetical protein